MAGMAETIQKVVSEITRGTRHPVYLLHGDELLSKDGAKAIVSDVKRFLEVVDTILGSPADRA